MDLYDRKMVTNTNLKYADSSSNYYVNMMVQNLKKTKTRKFPIFLAFPRDKMPTQSKQQPQSGCCLRKIRREAT